MTLKSEPIKQRAHELGFELVGVCDASPAASWEAYRSWIDAGKSGEMHYLRRSLDLRRSVDTLLMGARSIVAVGLYYGQGEVSAARLSQSRPRIAQYAWGRDYHKVLRAKLRALAQTLTQLDSCAAWRVCVDSAPALEREYAHRAGLGWFGKNTCLIDSKRGSMFVIGLLITTAQVEPDNPSLGSCGTCTRCVDECPTGCIEFQDGRWQIDARNCVSYLTIELRGDIPRQLEAGVGGWTFGCDVCQEVCPFNAPRASQPLRAPLTAEPDFQAQRDWPELAHLAELSFEDWDALTRGSAVRRAGHLGLRRNAALNLQNLMRKRTR